MINHAADRLPLMLLAALLLAAFAFGGGGFGAPLGNLTVQLIALGVLAAKQASFAAFWRESPFLLRLMIVASLALPILQIIPLPESVWSALPGRALVASAFDQAGQSGGWATYSVEPIRTLLALTALVTPLAVIWAGWTLPRDRLIDLGWLVVACGIVTVLIGTVQLSVPSESATLYGSREPGSILLGTFANRNSTGLFLTFALGLAALLPAPRPHPAVLPARLAVCALLLVAVVLTKSRTAIVLALLPVALGLIRALGATLAARNKDRAARRWLMIGLGALALVLVVGVGGLVVTAPGRIGDALERFEAKDDARRLVWEDAVYSADRYWPAGAGMGTYNELSDVDESLENVTLRRPGRVHNDYIELAIEAGAPGLALAAMWAVLVVWLTWRARGSAMRWAGWAGSAFILAIALQSITDYPLRNQTILALAGFALLLLARFAVPDERAKP